MDKEPVLLDTSLLIDYYRKKDKDKTQLVKLSSKYTFEISVITKLEILSGVNENQKKYWESIFSKMLIHPLFEKEVEIAAEIVQYLTKRNKIIGIKDILIGATALSKGLPISTLNRKDFDRIDHLILVEL
ncbi:MAG: type II toxin-antitoxin system VapC family toxin [Bacteroidales bacterium]|nr:type II toxin-antitoxin system VapC family toxin [Bacteroidales bacterium]